MAFNSSLPGMLSKLGRRISSRCDLTRRWISAKSTNVTPLHSVHGRIGYVNLMSGGRSMASIDDLQSTPSHVPVFAASTMVASLDFQKQHAARFSSDGAYVDFEASRMSSEAQVPIDKLAGIGSHDHGNMQTSTPESEDMQRLVREYNESTEALKSIPDFLRKIPKADPRGVYANHNLRLDHIEVYGFDYDYTIAHYTNNLHSLIYNLAKEHLVNELKYPDSCLKFEYDPTFPIRGLYYDTKKGYLLKLDFFHSVEPGACYFGRRAVTSAELRREYGGSHISIDHMPNLSPLLDLFCLSETCLISDVIQHFVDEGLDFDASYVYQDVKKCIDFVHRFQSMHTEILREPSLYLVKNDSLVKMLRLLKQRGKKMFMLTNSPFPFVDGGMRYLFQEEGGSGESWRDFFEVIVALSEKPKFYHSERPFRTYDTKCGSLGFQKVNSFEVGGVYYHGCLKDFLNLTNYRGPEVLYFGDQVYTDLRGPQRAGWRTAAIIHELENDIETSNQAEYRYNQGKYHVIENLLGRFHNLPVDKRGPAESAFLQTLESAKAEARSGMQQMFNPFFGSPFLTSSGKESAFAYNVQRYADVYTSRLDNFLRLSQDSWIYTPADVKILPHHVKEAQMGAPPGSVIRRNGDGNGFRRVTQGISSVSLSALLEEASNRQLVEAMRKGFQDGTLTHVTIETNGSGEIKTHRTVLGAISPVFQKMFEGEMVESQTKVVTIDDFPGPAVEAFIGYFYNQDIPPPVFEKYSVELWGLADKYQVEKLERHIVQLQPRFVTVENVLQLVSRADEHGAAGIKELCLW